MDIVGSFLMATDHRKFLLIAVDYFSKWVEAEPLFRIPHKLVSNNSRQFQGWGIREWCMSYGIKQAFTSMAYPQSNGQLDHYGGSEVDELSSVLWAYSTTPRDATGITPFHLIYGGESVVSIKIGVESDRKQLYDKRNDKRWLMDLDFVNQIRDKAVVRLMA
ncbi:uncharacterized protein LOC121986485 [Zingiber officinale]|uniref:uncharacterized protein LOC121986485 n=1 Tax=Zingiber officinale TaxID=94328 RepID=UPI001C4B564E|nr:uncharacterized protein LOC121986485 [Zingiber officinale]